MNTEVIPLVEGSLYQLPNPYELDGFVASHPATARGWAPSNAYVLVEAGRAILLDSCYSVHESSLLAQLGSVIDYSTPIQFFPTSIGEFPGICNAKPISDAFNVVKYYGIIDGANEWMDFRPEHAPYGGAVGGGSMATVENAVARGQDELDWAAGIRKLEVFQPPIRLLPCHWAYDAQTKTLFSGDSFNHVWRETSDGPWVVQPGEAVPTLDEVYDFLVGSRYWWLPGAATEELERAVVAAFESRQIERIAPRFGCVLDNPDTVEVHVELLLDVLRRAREEEPIGVHVGAEPMGRRS